MECPIKIYADFESFLKPIMQTSLEKLVNNLVEDKSKFKHMSKYFHDERLARERKTCYDSASVMSGDKGVNVYTSRHLEQNGVLSPAPFVHCASHNLNLVVNV